MEPFAYLRQDAHRQMLVDVGVVLHRAYGDDYARQFLKDMIISEAVILRVLTRTGLRKMMHLP